MAITDTIVTLDAVVTAAPVPSQLQQSGAFISVGATTALVTNSATFCATEAEVLATLGTTGNYVEVQNMAGTFFAQSSASQSPVGVYVLEIGAQSTPAAAITALGNYITANPDNFYAYLTPATWDSASSAAFNTMGANFSSPTSKTYFFGTTTQGHLANYTAQNKAFFMTVPSPTAAGTEFQAAMPFYAWLNNNPGPANPAAPMAYRFGYGVTPYAVLNNNTIINEILAGFGNVILTGAEGGISTATLFKGTTIDGNQAMFWYAVDWILIQAKQQLAAAIINGSNSNPPLYYNQNGINQLLGICEQIGAAGVAAGLFLKAEFSAVSFADYTKANPSDYAAGIYKGLSCKVTPQLGFLALNFFLDASQFAN